VTAYAEDPCALRWPLLLSGFGIPLLFAVFFALYMITKIWLFAVAAAVTVIPFWALTYGYFLMYVWPTGIRLDDAGVRIGGVRWAERHPGRRRRWRRPVSPGQRYWVFSCPWDGVQAMTLVTDPAALRELHRRSWGGRRAGLRTLLGVLGAPYMRAALVIKVDPRLATFPQFSDKRGLLYNFVPSPGPSSAAQRGPAGRSPPAVPMSCGPRSRPRPRRGPSSPAGQARWASSVTSPSHSGAAGSWPTSRR
jgi:hypothetical protein